MSRKGNGEQREQQATTAPPLLNGKQQLLLEAVLGGATTIEASRASGFSYSYTSRVLCYNAKFRSALAAARRDRLKAAAAKMDALVPLALRRLGDILSDPEAKRSDVIAVSRDILDRGGLPKSGRPAVSATDEPGDAVTDLATALDVDQFRIRQLREVREMRKQAQAGGSMVAATRLLETESQLLRDIDTARREAEAREAASEDAEHVLDRFLQAVDRMPRGMALELHAALSRTLEPAEAK